MYKMALESKLFPTTEIQPFKKKKFSVHTMKGFVLFPYENTYKLEERQCDLK